MDWYFTISLILFVATFSWTVIWQYRIIKRYQKGILLYRKNITLEMEKNDRYIDEILKRMYSNNIDVLSDEFKNLEAQLNVYYEKNSTLIRLQNIYSSLEIMYFK